MKTLSCLLLFAAVCSSIVQACSCAATPPISAALASSDVVVFGKCTAFLLVSDHERVARVEVSHTFKGAALPNIIEVSTSESSASCGFDFVPGRHYIIYGRIVDGVIRTSICTRTTSIRPVNPIEDEEFIALSLMQGLPPERWREFDLKESPGDPFVKQKPEEEK